MSFFNEGGMITRGMGKDHRIPTRGMAIRFDFGGIGRLRRKKEYCWNILLPVSKENYQEIDVYSPLGIERSREIPLLSNVSKEIHGEFDVLATIDHSRLSRIIEAL